MVFRNRVDGPFASTDGPTTLRSQEPQLTLVVGPRGSRGLLTRESAGASAKEPSAIKPEGLDLLKERRHVDPPGEVDVHGLRHQAVEVAFAKHRARSRGAVFINAEGETGLWIHTSVDPIAL